MTTNATRKPESERARKQRENQEKRHLETLAQIAQALEGSTAALLVIGAALLAIDALTSRHAGAHLFRPWYQ